MFLGLTIIFRPLEMPIPALILTFVLMDLTAVAEVASASDRIPAQDRLGDLASKACRPHLLEEGEEQRTASRMSFVNFARKPTILATARRRSRRTASEREHRAAQA